MKQPELGRKVSEIRNLIGLTQDELSKNCQLSLRTIQRIESGIVNPRSYTLKIIGDKLDFNFYSVKRKSKRLSFLKDWRNFIINRVIQFFNLKTSTMKKLSVLSVTSGLLGFCLFLLMTSSEAKGVKDEKFTKTKSRGIIYLFPRGLSIYISNKKDTADLKFGNDLIQEYKNAIFLNGIYEGTVTQGDTIILDNGKIKFLSSNWSYISSNGKGITYQIPSNIFIKNVSIQNEIEKLFLSNDQNIFEDGNKIYLNGIYVGDAFSNDLVILENNKLKCVKRQKQ